MPRQRTQVYDPTAVQTTDGQERKGVKDIWPVYRHIEVDALAKTAAAGRSYILGAGCSVKPAYFMICGWPTMTDYLTGRPMSGQAREILERALERLDVNPARVYLTYAVKCVYEDKSMTDERIRSWIPTLQRELQLVRPEKISLVGKLAQQWYPQIMDFKMEPEPVGIIQRVRTAIGL